MDLKNQGEAKVFDHKDLRVWSLQLLGKWGRIYIVP